MPTCDGDGFSATSRIASKGFGGDIKAQQF
jgi:hypothetical protein